MSLEIGTETYREFFIMAKTNKKELDTRREKREGRKANRDKKPPEPSDFLQDTAEYILLRLLPQSRLYFYSY